MNKLKDEHSRSRETLVEHYRGKYDGENDLPIWMATELLTFGSLSHLYSVLPLELKRKVADIIGVDDKILGGWLHSIVYVRNICAHHSRLWNRTLVIRPRCPKHWPYGKIDNAHTYLLLVVLLHILSKIAPRSTWGSRLIRLVDSHAEIDIEAMGFPSKWKTKEPWRAVNTAWV